MHYWTLTKSFIRTLETRCASPHYTPPHCESTLALLASPLFFIGPSNLSITIWFADNRLSVDLVVDRSLGLSLSFHQQAISLVAASSRSDQVQDQVLNWNHWPCPPVCSDADISVVGHNWLVSMTLHPAPPGRGNDVTTSLHAGS